MPEITIRTENGSTTKLDPEFEKPEFQEHLKQMVLEGKWKIVPPEVNKNIISIGKASGGDYSPGSGSEFASIPVGRPEESISDKVKNADWKGAGTNFATAAPGGFMAGGFPGAIGAGALNAAMGLATGNKPETKSDLLFDTIMNMVTVGGSKMLAPIKGVAKNAAANALFGGASTYGGGVVKQKADEALGNRPPGDLPSTLPAIMAAITSGAAGGLSRYTGNKLDPKSPNASPTPASSEFAEAMGMGPTKPYELENSLKSNTATTAPIRQQELAHANQVANDIRTQQRFGIANKGEKLLAKNDEVNALFDQKTQAAQSKISTVQTRPDIKAANDTIANSTAQIKSLETKLKQAHKNNPFDSEIGPMQQELELHKGQVEVAKQRLADISKQNQDNAVNKILTEAEMSPTGTPVKDARLRQNQAEYDKTQADDTLKVLQRKQAEGKFKFGANILPIIKNADNAEGMVRNIVQSDPFTIKEFMKTASQHFPDIKEKVVGDILRQSWDQNTKSFGNFSQLFGGQGVQGNLAPRLEAVLGSPDAANRAIDAITALDKGLKLQATSEGASKRILNWAVGTIVLSSTGGHGSGFHGTTNQGAGKALAVEGGLLTTLAIPKIINLVSQDKKTFEFFKKWADTGFNTALMSATELPIYQKLMDTGDHYRVDEYGNPELIKKK